MQAMRCTLAVPAYGGAGGHRAEQADVFSPVWLVGGAIWEVVFDYGRSRLDRGQWSPEVHRYGDAHVKAGRIYLGRLP